MSGNDWQTPNRIPDLVRLVGILALDPCTTMDNPLRARRFLTPESDPDGLLADWTVLADGGIAFVNPPYGRGYMDDWTAKIVREAARGCEVIALVRSDASTRWARELIKASTLICYPPRLRFKGATGSPNFSNSIHYLGRRPDSFKRAFQNLGPIVQPITKPINTEAK